MNTFTKETVEAATLILDNLLNLYRKAQKNFEENKGTLGEQTAYDFAIAVNEKYKATMQAYAAIGLTDLGIHNVKAGN